MSDDPYKTLGVKKDATDADIKKAYRSLAKKLHPDLNPGDKQAEEKFKNVTAAFDIVGDPEKRARFDKGEIDASGAERPQQRYYRDFAEANGPAHPYTSGAGFADFDDISDPHDILSEIFARGGPSARPSRGQNVRYRLAVDFLDAVNGATLPLTLPDGSALNVTLPPGTRDGQVLRLRGKGRSGGEAPSGDALIEIEVRPHSFFARDGDDIRLDLPVTLQEAVLGAKVTVPTPTGAVTMTIPKGSNTGRVLRLKSKGVPRGAKARGDQYVRLVVMLPETPDPGLETFAADWRPPSSYNPRRNLEAK